jgi:hypothetical protein
LGGAVGWIFTHFFAREDIDRSMFNVHLSFSDAPSARHLKEETARSATTNDK